MAERAAFALPASHVITDGMTARLSLQVGAASGVFVLVAPAHRSSHLAVGVGVASCPLHGSSVAQTTRIPMGRSNHFRSAPPPAGGATHPMATSRTS
jgi:hypothetical protein